MEGSPTMTKNPIDDPDFIDVKIGQEGIMA